MRSALLLLLLPFSVWAQEIPLQNLSEGDFDGLVKEFSANFAHRSVSGAGSLGDLFGFELGLIAGVTQTPTLDRLVKAADPTAENVARLPHGALLGMLSIPAGVTFEAGLIPTVGQDDFKFSTTSLAAKWTFSKLLEVPLDLAVRGHASKTKVDFKNTISNVLVTYKYENTVTGLTLLASKDFLFVEPYAAFGLIRGTGRMDVTGSTTVFASNALSDTSTQASTQLVLGAEFKLLVMKLGVELERSFGTSSATMKASFYF